MTVWLVVFQNMISYGLYIGSVYTTVYFTVDSIPPNLTVQSPQATTYNSSDIPLNFTVDKPHSWVSYSLDNQINATIDGNNTLTGLSEGHHSLTLFANDSMGYAGTTQTINFTVATSTEAPNEPFPTQLVAVSVVASVVIVVACAGVIVYLRKRKQ